MNQLVRNLENNFRKLYMRNKKEAFSLEFWKNKREYIGDDIKL